ncbi:unnamed protein product, partial [Mesorhabditis belari]|uniref:Uncharacterized protein n=1 Tax=Mesorhabditis belari TaxID=2138241 RepID=A0AAF3FQW3_9BILA
MMSKSVDSLPAIVVTHLPPICPRSHSTARGLEVERRVESVIRHGGGSNFGQSGSNFDLTSEKDPEETPLAASLLYERAPKQYTSSKSMQNLRLPHHQQQESPRKPRTPRRQWADESQADFNSHSLLAGLIEGSHGGQKGQSSNHSSPTNPQFLNNNNNQENVYAMPMPSTFVSPPTNGNYTAPLSMQQRLGQARLSSSPKTVQSPFNRSDQQRVSLSKTFLNKGLSIALQPKPAQTVWSPHQASGSTSSSQLRETPQSRRTMSTLTGGLNGGMSGPPTGAVASAITRRQSTAGNNRISPSTSATSEKIRRSKTFGRMKDIQEQQPQQQTHQRETRRADDYSSSNLHLRSRSQSPNHLLSAGLLTPRRRDSDMSMQNHLSASSRALTSSRTNLNQPEGIRKSNQALDKLANMRSKLRQSTENIMGDEGAAGINGGLQAPSSVLRSKSIGNLRNGNQLEPFGTFDVEATKPKLGSSLGHSRLLARSMGNVSASEESAPKAQTASNQLAHTIQMLKKASNPDLTQPDQFEESTSFQDRLIRRGAVQKRVERYHPRNRPSNVNGRGTVGTSEESDSASNTSDASPMNGSLNGQAIGRRYFGVTGNRSSSSVESRGAVASSRRLFDPKHGSIGVNGGPTTPTRRGNYLASKLAGEGDVAPDLASDESARAPSTGPSDLLTQIPEKDQPMVRHVDAALKQALIAVDQALHAEKLLRESDVADRTRDALNEQCLKTLQQISGRVSTVLERSGVPSVDGGRRSTDDSLRYENQLYNLGNGLPTSTTTNPVDMNAFLAQHGNQLMELLKNNLAKSN